MKKILSAVMTTSTLDTRMILLYCLNTADYMFTLVLISSGLFKEANPLLSFGIGGMPGFLSKCILPVLLLGLLHIRIAADPPENIFAAKLLLDAGIVFYFAVNCLHVFWLFYFAVLFM